MRSLAGALRAINAEVARRERAGEPVPAETVQALEQLSLLRAQNPLAFFEPANAKQAAYLAAHSRLSMFAGGNGAGKSIIGTAKDVIQAIDRSAVPSHLQRYKFWEPPVFQRIVVPKDDQIEGVALDKIRQLCPPSQFKDGSIDKAYNKVARRLSFANGSWILFNTHGQDRDAHAGVELHRVRFDEEPPGEAGRGLYTENIARLRRFMPEAEITFTMTPLFGLSWTYDEVWEKRGLEVRPGVYQNPDESVFCVVSSMFDNPFIDQPSMEAALKGLSEEERAAVIEGKFIHFHGAVLNVKAEHLIDAPSPDHVRGLDVYVGIDPGIRRAGVVFCGFDRDNGMLVFDELYPEAETIPSIVRAIRGRLEWWGIPEDRVVFVIDPAARNRELTNAESVQGEFNREGIYPNPGQNDRLAGVLQMRARLEHRGLLVSRACENWIREARRWLIAKDEVTEQQSAKVKGAGGTFATIGPDHLMDPTRYVAMERLWYERPVVEVPQRNLGWTPGQAPSADWLTAMHPQETGPLGAMS